MTISILYDKLIFYLKYRDCRICSKEYTKDFTITYFELLGNSEDYLINAKYDNSTILVEFISKKNSCNNIIISFNKKENDSNEEKNFKSFLNKLKDKINSIKENTSTLIDLVESIENIRHKSNLNLNIYFQCMDLLNSLKDEDLSDWRFITREDGGIVFIRNGANQFIEFYNDYLNYYLKYDDNTIDKDTEVAYNNGFFRSIFNLISHRL